ncbi:hypothetical protein M407DRAFT_18715 [Tulasnella calospora MUT 4182]|uniref:Carbohydrate-binding module family 1 protein n=1 Tax=Tulasnella calospora MUT 4182 TaxID=1051891 RepID=A0A0C3QV22_9AGAM|nr:hypothetical protein M407DRAFT_18715 [Tulasnella calospora MUT 4182]
MNFKLALAALLTTSAASVFAAPAPAPNPIAEPAPQTTCTAKGAKCNTSPYPCCAPSYCHAVADGAYGWYCY